MPTATPSPTPSPTPTPPPTPTPTPTPPPPLAHCYQPRPASLQATPAPATPGVEPPGPALALRPAGARSLFQRCQVIAYYGFPGEPVMGILGSADPDTVVRQLVAQAAEYDATNGERQVVPALHLIYAVAQGSPTEDATYLARMPDEVVQAYLAAAERHDLLVFLDIQMGHSSVAAELPHVLEYLKNPRVHLALDPEFATPGAVPGTIIGGMDAAEINAAQAMLQRLVEDAGLYNKILIVHQFDDDMIRNKPALAPYPGVDLVVDMDGFGYAAAKIGGYTRFVQEDGAPHGGFKLFYDQDVDLMTPAQVNQLVPQPDVVIYQ
ncbi:MAG: hypothetical protein QJR03_02430 [Sphaerobacter sp.]|nr:hypothetical protein [Sphaerobacter sp.]